MIIQDVFYFYAIFNHFLPKYPNFTVFRLFFSLNPLSFSPFYWRKVSSCRVGFSLRIDGIESIYFNSKMVRLKALSDRLYGISTDTFQFQDGAVKRMRPNALFLSMY